MEVSTRLGSSIYILGEAHSSEVYFSQVNMSVCFPISEAHRGSHPVTAARTPEKAQSFTQQQDMHFAPLVLLRSGLVVVRASLFFTCPLVTMVLLLSKDLVVVGGCRSSVSKVLASDS